MERLSKVIANSGFASRRKVDELISKGEVLVNGVVAQLGQKVNSSDTIIVDGKVINQNKGNYVYYLLNKPRGIITSNHDEKGRKTVIDLINTDERIYPVGRLDYDTTGSLLLTNDGELTNRLLHPRNNIEKIYLAKIQGIITGTDINKLKNGLIIDNFKTSPARVKLKSFNRSSNTSLVLISIHEGHNHQVKKMFEAIGYKVDKLTRLSFAGLDVKKLKSGEYRMLSLKEVQRLYSMVK